MHCKALQSTAKHCNVLQRTATHCNALLHTATHCDTLQRTATHRDALQHTATHCNALQRTATHRNTLHSYERLIFFAEDDALMRDITFTCDMTHTYVTWLIHMSCHAIACDMNLFMSHDSYIHTLTLNYFWTAVTHTLGVCIHTPKKYGAETESVFFFCPNPCICMHPCICFSNVTHWYATWGGGLGSSTIFKKFNETYALS